MTLVAYNVVALARAALRVTHGGEFVENELSTYYLTDDVGERHRLEC